MNHYLCRDCARYCVYCQMCHEDKEVHEMNDSCSSYEPLNEESEDDE